MPNVINVLAKWTAWGILFGLLLVTVVPAGARPVVVHGHYAEHILAFGSLGLAFAIAYRQQTMVLLIGLTCFCFAIEVTQLFLPTRHARWQDLVVDAFAVCAGVMLARALQRTLKLRPG